MPFFLTSLAPSNHTQTTRPRIPTARFVGESTRVVLPPPAPPPENEASDVEAPEEVIADAVVTDEDDVIDVNTGSSEDEGEEDPHCNDDRAHRIPKVVDCSQTTIAYALPLNEGDDWDTTKKGPKEARVLQVLEEDQETAATSPLDSTDSLPTVPPHAHPHHVREHHRNQQPDTESTLNKFCDTVKPVIVLLLPLLVLGIIGYIAYGALTVSSHDNEDVATDAP